MEWPRLKGIRNETIWNKIKVSEIHKKVKERRLGRHGHVMRRDESYVGKNVLAMEVEGKGRKGRPHRRWADCIQEDLKRKEIGNNILKTESSGND